MRFQEVFARLESELALAGHVVLAPTSLGVHLTEEQDALLGRIHLHKIAMSDRILVVNVGGYLGASTRREIARAQALGVLVTYLEAHDD